jgi:hypothetical protein
MDRSLAHRPLVLTLLALALLPALGSAQAVDDRPSGPSGPSGASGGAVGTATGLPDGVVPLEAALDERVHGLVERAEKLRGLRALSSVRAGTLSEAALQAQMTSAIHEHLDSDQLRALELGLKAFGLIPEAMNLGRYLPDLMTSQVAGYYDSERKYLALVRRPAPAGGGSSPHSAEAFEDLVVVHELVHALQDQHFDLQRFERTDPTTDESTALTALVEGDATLVMMFDAAGADFSFPPGFEQLLEKALDNPALFDSADLPGGEAMREAPPFLRDSLLFSYLKGVLFAFKVRQAGGQSLLDYAFATDPPRSTEQVLHAEKWHGDRDDPIDLKLPDPGAGLSRLAERSGGEMGELGVYLLLRETLGDAQRAGRAAAGWGGDRFEVYAGAGERRLVWLLDWDTERDAGEFAAAAEGLGRGWRVERLAPRRVAVLRGGWSRKELSGLRQRLAAVAAKTPPNARIDFAALGAGPQAARQP